MVGGFLRYYGAPDYVVAEAELKCKQIRQGSPNTWRDNGPRWFERLKQLEPLATTIDIFEDNYVTGVLQTRAYGRAVMEVGGQLTLSQIEDALDLRASRREAVVESEKASKIRVIQTQYSLDIMGDEDFCEEQMEQLRADNARPNIEIYILPARRFHPSMEGPYMILSFDDENERDVGYHEGPFGAHYEATKQETDRVRDVFSDTLAMAERLE